MYCKLHYCEELRAENDELKRQNADLEAKVAAAALCTHVYVYIYIYIYMYIIPEVSGVKRSFIAFDLNYLHVLTLMLTDVQTPFLGTPLVPLKVRALLGKKKGRAG